MPKKTNHHISLSTAAAPLLDAAFDAWRSGKEVNENVRVTIAGREVKLHIVGNNADYPKGFVLRVVWKPLNGT
jgi:hypothetical protein